MSEREKRIVEAAIRVFSRYGVKRTTMNDIASEAGLVRQTLYNAYANKDEILRATIRYHTDRSLAAIEAECAEVSALGDKLDVAFEHLVAKPFELLRASPHADEILTGLRDAAREKIALADERSRAALEDLLAPHEKQIRAAGLTPFLLSDLMQRSCYGFKHKARDRKHLLELLSSLKSLVLRVADGT